jgi:alpha-1,3-rhamnosyl/mannosyltransferase
LQRATLAVAPIAYGVGIQNKVLEAMACGTPVVCSNSSSLPEVAGDAALLVDPRDAAAIADGLERVLRAADLRADLAARGPARAARFSWARTAAETVAVYERMARR